MNKLITFLVVVLALNSAVANTESPNMIELSPDNPLPEGYTLTGFMDTSFQMLSEGPCSNWFSLGKKDKTFPLISGDKSSNTTIYYYPKICVQGKNMYLDVDIDLSQMAANMVIFGTKELAKDNHDSDCGTDKKFKMKNVYPKNDALIVEAYAKFKVMNCGSVLGNRIWQTVVVQEDATARVQLGMAYTENEVRLVKQVPTKISGLSDLTKFVKSLLGAVDNIANLFGANKPFKSITELTKSLEADIDKALSEMDPIKSPEDIKNHKPKFTYAGFYKRNDGSLGASIKAELVSQ